MSNKFTGITSAGSAIPVYDKDAHEALSSKLDTSAFSSVSGEFATVDDVVAAVSGKADTSAIPSLDGYATQEWVGEQGYLTEVPAGYATTEDVISATSGLQPSGDYLSASESANFYPMTGNPAGFLTEHQSLDGYLQNSDLTIVDDKITEISGVPLSAGDELPESVSAATDYITATSGDINATIDNVSSNSGAWGGNALPISARDGLDLEMSGDMLWIGASALNETLSGKQDTLTFEYNESSAISAINGSALAGGGGSEQQEVSHDNTLSGNGTSASPLGVVNGYNETVLFTASAPLNTITLSEKGTNFERLLLELSSYQEPTVVNYYEIKPNDTKLTYFSNTFITNATFPLQILGCQFSSNDGLSYTTTTGLRICMSGDGNTHAAGFYTTTGTNIATDNMHDAGFITKVIGINRK